MNGRNDIIQYEVFRQLRFPMIVLVTFAHSYGEVAEGFSLLASEWNTYEFLKLLVSQTLVKVAVPVFFIMSGYLFFSNVKEWNLKVYKAKIMRRVKTLHSDGLVRTGTVDDRPCQYAALVPARPDGYLAAYTYYIYRAAKTRLLALGHSDHPLSLWHLCFHPWIVSLRNLFLYLWCFLQYPTNGSA